MDNPGYIALSRLGAQQRSVDTIAHNIANANTPGFKANRLVFEDFVARTAGERRPGAREVAFNVDRGSYRDQAPGALTRTDNPLDLALGGDGFFVIDTPRGERFSRSGRFTIAPDGRVTTSEGYALMSTDGRPITVTEQDSRLTVSADGTVESQNGPLGRVRIVTFEDQNRLVPEGETLFRGEGMEPQAAAQPKVVQGMLEESNVNAILEMTRMMTEVREFQFVHQFLEREGERLANVVERLTRKRN